jgi:L-alanine-DL-glutamate epimerase-like enolase superfamily enzyme
VTVSGIDVSAYTISTDLPESDGTLAWDSTTLVLVEAHGGGETGIGYTYGEVATARLVEETLAPLVRGRDALAPAAAWGAMSAALRNAGRPGLGLMAVSAVDVALWDLEARLLGVPLARLLGAAHERVPVYGSGGFTSYTLETLAGQLAGWVEEGIPRVKLKVGREPARDPERLAAVRAAIGEGPALYVDANGAFTPPQALAWAERFASEWDVSWFEEPVSSDDLEGLRRVRGRAPAGMDVAAGEYAYLPRDFRELVVHRAVDCLQADVTRCGGVTGILRVAGLCEAHELDLSAHGAPAASAHAFCAVPRLRHLEYFHDHVRVEGMLFDGVLRPEEGALRPDPARLGLGLELRRADAAHYRVYGGG